jgi:dihydropyrimidinase
MFSLDLVIKNAIVATASDEFASDIGIKDGKIALLAPSIPTEDGCEVIDAEGGYVTVSFRTFHPACSVSL